MKNYFTKAFRSSFLVLAIGLSVVSCKKNAIDNPEKPASQENVDMHVVPGKYIVVLNDNAVPSLKNAATYEQSLENVINKANQLLAASSTKSEVVFDNIYSTALKGFSANLSAEQVKTLKMSSDVISIEPDCQINLDSREMKPLSTKLPSSTTRADYWPWGIKFVGGAKYGDGRVAWVIDSGIDLDHPDLNVDQNRGRNFCSSYGYNATADDDNGHGSHVAGTIAAKYNGIGVVGVAANATVVPVKVVDYRGSGIASDCVKAVDYVAYSGKKGDVANMSLGYPTNSAIDRAVKNAASKGIKFAIAAGNERSNALYVTPARVVAPNVYKVCAIDSNGNWASFSNYGNVVDWAAPGVGVWSTYKDGQYSKLDGTSMASPHIAGMLLVSGSLNTNGSVRCPYDSQSYPIAKH
ncbi:MAG: S8 family serine peptidase [Bacteroidales bacterium]